MNTLGGRAGRWGMVEMSKMGLFASCAAVSLIAISAPCVSRAEDAPKSTEGSVQEVVVTAQKREERLRDVPVPVTVLNADRLADRGQVLLRDYYSSVPGLSVAPDIETTQMLSIRGISTGSFSIPTVGVMIDDIPFTGSTNSGAGNNVPDIDPGDLERIEILRGPQGALYGANSMGGVIKFVTKDPSFNGYSGRLEAGYSSVHNGDEPGFSIRGSANISISDTLAMRVSGFGRQDPGYIDNPVTNRKGVNQVDAGGGRVSLLWKPTDTISLKLGALYQNTRGKGLSEIDMAPGLGDLQQNYVAGVDRWHTTNQAYSAVANASFAGIHVTSATGFESTKSVNPFDFTPIFGGPNSLIQKQYGVTSGPWITHIDYSKFSEEMRFSGEIGKQLEWLVGGYYTFEHAPNSFQQLLAADSTGKTVAEFWHRGDPFSFQEYAVFGNLTYHFTDRFDVQVGLRQSYTHETDYQNDSGPFVPLAFGETSPHNAAGSSTGKALTYLFTPRYKLSSDVMIYARLASGFRPGGPNAFATGVPASFSPDKTNNYEIGLKGGFFDNRLTLDASLYYIDWKNIQITLFKSPFTYGANGGGAKSEGVELSVVAKPADGLTVSGWVDYDNAVLTENFPAASSAYGHEGDRLPNTPRFSSNVAVNYEFSIRNGFSGFVGGTASYVGERVGLFVGTPARQIYPEYTKLDVDIGIRYEAWTGRLYVNNISDKRGVISGGIGYIQPIAFAYIQPRTIGITVSKDF